MLKVNRSLLFVSALGYFVDVYDLVLFGIVRVRSLRALGCAEADLLRVGAQLLNLQMAGMLIGGFAWGRLGDRYGRTRVLFSSILIYSAANLANAFVANVGAYGLLRFVAGFGLAGELGVAVTLVSEILPRATRGWGSVIIGFAGFTGAIVAAILGGLVAWRVSYFCGGCLGLTLLLARFKVHESTIFQSAQLRKPSAVGGRFVSRATLLKYLHCFFVGVPIWFVSGLLMYFAPEFARALAIAGSVTAAQAILWNYCGSLPGDLLSGYVSQRLRSRKAVIQALIIFAGCVIAMFFMTPRNAPVFWFYGLCFLLGIANGYWTLFVAMTAEQFGTNVRATAATSVPNLVRGAVIPITLTFQALVPAVGVLRAGAILGAACIGAALINLYFLRESFGIDLNFVE